MRNWLIRLLGGYTENELMTIGKEITPSEQVEVSCDAMLCDLTNAQLDHVSRGLEVTFGAVLSGNAGEPETFAMTLETGKVVALHARTLTVQDVWDTANKLTP